MIHQLQFNKKEKLFFFFIKILSGLCYLGYLVYFIDIEVRFYVNLFVVIINASIMRGILFVGNMISKLESKLDKKFQIKSPKKFWIIYKILIDIGYGIFVVSGYMIIILFEAKYGD